MSLENVSRREFLRRALVLAAAAAPFVQTASGLLVPAAYAETDTDERPSLQENINKMLSEEDAKVEEARQRIYIDLTDVKGFANKREVAKAHLRAIEALAKNEKLPLDGKFFDGLERRLAELTGKEEHPMLPPGETHQREIEQVVFTAYDRARQSIRLRQLRINPGTAFQDFVFVPRGNYTIGIPRAEIERYIEHLERTSVVFHERSPYTNIKERFLAMSPSQEVLVDDFFISRIPITNAQLDRFMRSDAAGRYGIEVLNFEALDQRTKDGYREMQEAFWRNGTFTKGTEDYPVLFTNRRTMETYAAWIGKELTGKEGRLPTTFEGEAAGRGATRSVFSYGTQYREHWEKLGAKRSNRTEIEGNTDVWQWTPNRHLSRDTRFQSTFGVKWMGVIGNILLETNREARYGTRETTLSGKYGAMGGGTGSYVGTPGTMEMVSYRSEVSDADINILYNLGFRVVIPAKNLQAQTIK